MVGTIITNLSDGLRDNLVGIVLSQTFIRKGPSNQDIWRIVVLFSDGSLFELVCTEHMLTFLSVKETE